MIYFDIGSEVQVNNPTSLYDGYWGKVIDIFGESIKVQLPGKSAWFDIHELDINER